MNRVAMMKNETFLHGAVTGGLGAAIKATESVLGSMRSAYLRLTGEEPPRSMPAATTGQRPAVPIEMSVTPDYIVCLEDGQRFKMLKGHLRASYGMSPQEYRKKWGLSADYPMVAPNYREKRARMAKQMGLGHMRHPKQSRTSKEKTEENGGRRAA